MRHQELGAESGLLTFKFELLRARRTEESATGLLLGNEVILMVPQLGQYIWSRTHRSVHTRALCVPLL
jgi:hypothetical protein